MRRLVALSLAGVLIVFVACGSGSKSNGPGSPRQPTDPKTVPTATIPAALPSPIVAATVSDAGLATGGATTTPSAYTVKSGDTLAAIASQLGVPLSALESYNNGVNPSSLKIGQELRIPPAAASATASATPAAGRTATPGAGASATATGTRGAASSTSVAATGTATATAAAGSGQTYTVKAGDTGCKLAGTFQVSLQELAEANGTTTSGLTNLKVGQQIKVPPPTGSPRGC